MIDDYNEIKVGDKVWVYYYQREGEKKIIHAEIKTAFTEMDDAGAEIDCKYRNVETGEEGVLSTYSCHYDFCISRDPSEVIKFLLEDTIPKSAITEEIISKAVEEFIEEKEKEKKND